MNRFFIAVGNSKEKAEQLYRINLLSSQAFYPILNLFETFLRNNIASKLSEYFSNPNWIITEKTGFMDNPSLEPSKFFLKNSVLKAEKTLRKKGKSITSDKVIAEQSFSFWTSLFDKHHYKLVGGSIIHCFPNKPTSVNRDALNRKLNRIRDFRNRVYHNEPICFIGQSLDFRHTLEVRQDIYELLEWVNLQLVVYVRSFDKIDSTVNLITKLD